MDFFEHTKINFDRVHKPLNYIIISVQEEDFK